MSNFYRKWNLQDAFQIRKNLQSTNSHSNKFVKKRLDRIYIDSRIRKKLRDCRLLEEFKQISTHRIIAISFQIQKEPILKVGNPRYLIPQWMSQDENIIKDLNNNEQSSLTPFSNWNGIINQIQEKVIFYKKYQRYIRAYTPNIGNVPDEKMLKFRFRPSFNFSIITEMQTESGNTVQDTEIMINLATKFYQDLFLVEDRHLESFTFVDQFDKKIDETDKVLLEKAFIEDNVYDHSLMINKKNAVGTDGISYQNLIELRPSLSESLIRAGNNILKYGTLPQQMSEVIITLIPKKLKTPIIENFRPISVISCAVRLLSSVIEKQLNPVLAKVIENTQTGFLKKRSISNSIYLLDMVLTRYQTSKTAEAESAGLVNLDFRKAFDSVHHDFVLLVLRQVGLEPKATNFFDGNNHKTKSKSKY